MSPLAHDPHMPTVTRDLEKKTTGTVISELARKALTSPDTTRAAPEPKAIHGLRPFAKRGGIVTNELIDRLREDDAY